MKRVVPAICMVMSILMISFIITGCFGSVVPVARVHFKQKGGYVHFSTSMYAGAAGHIMYYETLEDKENNNYTISISFFPRVMGIENVTYDGEEIQTQLVDISDYVDISLDINKNSGIFSSEKSVYINGEKVVPKQINDLSNLYCVLIQNVNLKRANPNGKMNDEVNIIEYKI